MYQHIDKVENILNEAIIKYLEPLCAQSSEVDQVAEVVQNMEISEIEEGQLKCSSSASASN